MKRCFEIISEAQQKIDFKTVEDYDIKLPKRATTGSAGYDFFAPYDICLNPGEAIVIPTGIRVHMNQNEVLMIYPRSGLGTKYYLRLANSTGIIDSDYYYSDNEGHIFLKLRNESTTKILSIKQGGAICQGVFTTYLLTDDDEIGSKEIRNGGFGSTTA